MNTHSMIVAGMALAVLAGVAGAETGPDLLLKPFAPGAKGELRADITVLGQVDNAAVAGPRTQLTVEDFGARYRLTLDSTSTATRADFPISPVFGYQHTYIHINSTEPALPGQLFDQSVAVGASLFRSQTFELLGSIGIGFAGTTPYAQTDALYGKAHLTGRFTLDVNSTLDVSLTYSGNRAIFPDVPLPGVAYTRSTSDRTLRYSIGVPYSYVNWKATDRLTLDLSWLPIYNFSARATYAVAENLSVYADFSSRTDAFVFADTRDRRLFFSQRRAELGATLRAAKHVDLTAAAGYAFSQEFTTGFDVRNDDGLVDLEPAPYFRVGMSFSF